MRIQSRSHLPIIKKISKTKNMYKDKQLKDTEQRFFEERGKFIDRKIWGGWARMAELETKKQKVINALRSEDYNEALKIAKSFHIELSKEENTIVRRAYEMQWNPSFYEALGFDSDEEYEKAVKILLKVYSKYI